MASNPSNRKIVNKKSSGNAALSAPALESSDELSKFLAVAGKKHSKGTIQKGVDTRANYGKLQTGILALDIALNGGFSLSRVNMLYGYASSGKSTLATISIARMQKLNPNSMIFYVDIEGTFDKQWAETLGVDLDRLYLVEPDTGEDAVDLICGCLRIDTVSLVVVDSIAMLSPMKEIESAADDNFVALQARLVGSCIRKITNAVITERKRDHHPIVFLINQFRTNIGQMFGDNRTLPGGNILKYAVSQSIEMKNKEIKQTTEGGDGLKGEVLYNEHSFNITKDKTGGSVKEGDFRLIRSKSIGLPVGFVDQTKHILKTAKRLGLYSGGGVKQVIDGLVFSSEDDLTRQLAGDPELSFAIVSKLTALTLESM